MTYASRGPRSPIALDEMQPAPLPSYLTSGASSRAHHAFLVKIHQAVSEQEEDEIIREEVRCAKDVLRIGQESVSVGRVFLMAGTHDLSAWQA